MCVPAQDLNAETFLQELNSKDIHHLVLKTAPPTTEERHCITVWHPRDQEKERAEKADRKSNRTEQLAQSSPVAASVAASAATTAKIDAAGIDAAEKSNQTDANTTSDDKVNRRRGEAEPRHEAGATPQESEISDNVAADPPH